MLSFELKNAIVVRFTYALWPLRPSLLGRKFVVGYGTLVIQHGSCSLTAQGNVHTDVGPEERQAIKKAGARTGT